MTPAQIAAAQPMLLEHAGTRVALLKVKATFGTSGAISSYADSTTGVVVAKPTGTGVYTITATGCQNLILMGEPAYVDATFANRTSLTVNSNTAGVITLQCAVEDNTSGIAVIADATSGDSMECVLLAEF